MTISSRTPEGWSHRCSVCDEAVTTEPSYPGGDSCRPACGSILWWFRDRFPLYRVELDVALELMGLDSIETVELVMELEEVFDVTIGDHVATPLRTIEDAICYIRRRQP